jgi:hypothetical protein
LKALKLQLAIAKQEYIGLTAPCLMPDTKAYTRAIDYIRQYGATLIGNSNVDDTLRKFHSGIIARNDAVLAYRAEKKRLSEAVNTIRREMLAAATRSDLE